jgi:hypothetical protein
MEKENRESLTNEMLSRVLNLAPVSEVLRVYSLSVQNTLDAMSESELLESCLKAGYTDLIEKYADIETMILGEDETRDE